MRGKGRRQHFREPTAHDESRHQEDAREINIQARVEKIGNIFGEFVNARIRFNTSREADVLQDLAGSRERNEKPVSVPPAKGLFVLMGRTRMPVSSLRNNSLSPG